jgi:2-succinyl-5-enolpyruvyl-6-hydroxy-3-cyclohexene-1-carboxylate synthase
MDDMQDYVRLIRNPSDVDYAGIAQAFGLTYRRCTDKASLVEALSLSTQHQGLLLIEACVPADSMKRELAGFAYTLFNLSF